MQQTSEERSPSQIIEVITHEQFLCMINYISKQILKSIENKLINPFMGIYGVPRGGLVPAVYLSHRLNVPLVKTLDAVLSDSHNPYLIVEDVIDTGKTLSRLIMFLTNEDKIVSLITKPWNPLQPDFYAYQTIN